MPFFETYPYLSWIISAIGTFMIGLFFAFFADFSKKTKKYILIISSILFVGILLTGLIYISLDSDGTPTEVPVEPIESGPLIETIVVIAGNEYSSTLEKLDLSVTDANYDTKRLTNEDIVGLKYMTNLKELDLSNNEISDISVLENLTTLEVLNLENNTWWGSYDSVVIDITPIGNLVNLKELNISRNDLSSLHSLSSLNKLEVLDISNNKIIVVNELNGLNNLKKLDVSENPIETIKLGYLPNLEVFDASRCELHVIDFESDNQFPNLLTLNLCCNFEDSLSNVRGIRNLPKLEVLDLATCNIENIDGIQSLSELKKLCLYGNVINDIDFLMQLRNLDYLHLGGNPVIDFSQLSVLSNLAYLDLSDRYTSAILWEPNYFMAGWGYKCSDISSLSSLRNIETLMLSNNDIQDISVLSNLTQLKILFIDGNRIDNINALSSLNNLSRLSISWNKVDDLSPLSALPLTYLNVSGNELKNIEPVKYLASLQELNCGSAYDIYELSYDENTEYYQPKNDTSNDDPLDFDFSSLLRYRYNFIIDISPIASLENLSILYLDGNPVNDLSPLANLSNLHELSLEACNSISDWSPVSHIQDLKR